MIHTRKRNYPSFLNELKRCVHSIISAGDHVSEFKNRKNLRDERPEKILNLNAVTIFRYELQTDIVLLCK
jgi:hypothetical protein